MTELSGLLSSSSETKKHLFVCFMQCPGSSKDMAYLLQSVSVDSLVPKSSPSEASKTSPSGASKTPLPKFELQHCWVEELRTSGMGCISVGARLYFFGGQMPEEDDDCAWNFDCDQLSTEVHCYYLPELVNFPLSLDASFRVPGIPKSPPVQMKSGNCYPIVAEVGGLIYVLGNTIIDGYFPLVAFEVYDPWKNKWADLPSPDHVHYNEWFHGWSCGRVAYVVLDKKICVSVAGCSFAFDTRKGRWKACKLFASLDPFEVAFYRSVGPPSPKRSRKEPENDGGPCGPRFGFSGRGVLYGENILLGALPPYVPLVAYLLVDGKAERMQCFWLNLSDDVDPDWAYRADIVDLGGGGYFCYMYDSTKWSRGDKAFVTLVTFKISRAGGSVAGQESSGDDEFLTCEVVGQKYELKKNWRLPCEPIYAFAM